MLVIPTDFNEFNAFVDSVGMPQKNFWINKLSNFDIIIIIFLAYLIQVSIISKLKKQGFFNHSLGWS